MKLNKKVIESMTVVSAMAVMSTFTALAGSTEESVTVAQTTSIIVIEKTGTAGIITELQKIETEAISESGLIPASIERVESNLVAEGNAQAEEDSQDSLGETAGISEVVKNALESTEEMQAEEQPEEKVELAEAAEEQSEEQADDVEPKDEKAEETVENTESEEEKTEDVEAAEDTESVDEYVEDTEAAENADSEDEKSKETEEEEKSEEEKQPEESENEEWANQVMANVEEEMNIRTSPDETSELAGKFYRGDVAEIVEVGDEWTEITSGNVTGFVKNDYLVFGDDACKLANEVCSMYATVNTDGLRLRSEPNEEAGIITTASIGEKLKVDKEAEAMDGWVAVKTSDSTAYVSADYVDVALNLGTALNSEEVKEKEAAKAAEEAKKAGKKPAMSAGASEVALLGALIQCEAGNSSYEGMVAVGAVVMNRVRSGAYPGSISGVIYQPGQFPPALSGSVANIAAGGVRSACLQAAQEAINGTDNTNGALQFRSAGSGHGGTVIGGNVFF